MNTNELISRTYFYGGKSDLKTLRDTLVLALDKVSKEIESFLDKNDSRMSQTKPGSTLWGKYKVLCDSYTSQAQYIRNVDYFLRK